MVKMCILGMTELSHGTVRNPALAASFLIGSVGCSRVRKSQPRPNFLAGNTPSDLALFPNDLVAHRPA